jgi:exodeoxyribonuclease VII large subunit
MFPTSDADSAYTPPAVLSVTALNQQVARLLERTFPLTWIGGEISNFTRAASGHWYFTLKDDAAQVRAVMFRGRAQSAGFIPREADASAATTRSMSRRSAALASASCTRHSCA